MNKDIMVEEVRESAGMEIVEVKETHFLTFDEYNDRDIIFRFLEHLDKASLIDFGSVSLNKETFLSILEEIPAELFMNVQKIILVGNKSDYDLLDKKSPNHTLKFKNNVGMCVFFDSNILINVNAIIEGSKEEFKEWEEMYQENAIHHYNVEAEIQQGIIETLYHELWHLHQFNPLFEEEFSGIDRETDAEDRCKEFVRSLYENRKMQTFLPLDPL